MTTTPHIYLDNAATAWPKAPSVEHGMIEALLLEGSSGRSAHAGALKASRMVFASRKKVANFFGVEKIENIIFQPSCTQAANLVLKGYLRPGDSVLVASTEHNSITRPLYELAQQGVEVTWIPADSAGVVDLAAAEKLLDVAAKTGDGATPGYKAVVCQHGSNVSGAIQPIAELTALAHAHDAAMIVDGAQAGGHIPVDLGTLGADAWFCSGHKGFRGPQGIGVLYLASNFVVPPLVTGGTGSGGRDHATDPLERPDAYEAGTAPLPAIGGLSAAFDDLAREAEDDYATYDARTRQLHEGLAALPSVRVLGPALGEPRLPIVSFVSDVVTPDVMAAHLDMEYGIAARAGVHCAPAAHEVLGTGTSGAVRLSPGPTTTAEEIDRTINAISSIVREAISGTDEGGRA